MCHTASVLYAMLYSPCSVIPDVLMRPRWLEMFSEKSCGADDVKQKQKLLNIFDNRSTLLENKNVKVMDVM